jgi:nucleotide-binding universal stress UspA family protein
MARKARTFRSILVPLDGSPLAEQAIPLAVEIASATRSKVRLVLVHQVPPHAFDPESARLYRSLDLAMRKAAREYLTGLTAPLRESMGRRISSVIIDGPPGPALVDYVGEIGADVVTMTTHGRGGRRDTWLGSVADHLIRRLEIPVILVRAREDAGGVRPPPIREILVPLDGSPPSETVLAPAAAIAGLFEAELLLVHVVQPAAALGLLPIPFAAGSDDILAIQMKEAREYLDDLAEELRGRGVRAAGTVVVGNNVVQALLDLARPERVGLVAITTHGRGGLQRLMLGSVTDKLIRAAETPVLVVRPGKGGSSPSRRR